MPTSDVLPLKPLSLDCSCCRIQIPICRAEFENTKMPIHNLTIVFDFSMPGRFSLRNSQEEIPPPLPEKKRNSAGLYESDAQSSRSSMSFTTNLTLPSNRSPTNSISSMLSVSSEELLDEPPPKPSRLPSDSLHRRDSRSSQYDNIDTPFECSSNVFEFNKTFQMGMPCEVTNSSLPPPLPVKKGSTSTSYFSVRHGSQYDNFTFEQTSRSPPAVFGPTCNRDNIFMSLTANNNATVLQPDVVPRVPSKNVSPHLVTKVTEFHKKTYSVTRLQESIVQSLQVNNPEVSNAEGSQLPPPIPPKKHGQLFFHDKQLCTTGTYLAQFFITSLGNSAVEY